MINLADIPNAKSREKAKYWLSVFEDWEKSKLTKERYCKLNKISSSTLYYWFNYLQGKSSHPHAGREKQPKNKPKKAKSKFIALEVTKELPLANNYATTATGLKIILPRGFSLSIEKNFDPESLLQVIKVLEPLC
jgi:hypothetical protein